MLRSVAVYVAIAHSSGDNRIEYRGANALDFLAKLFDRWSDELDRTIVWHFRTVYAMWSRYVEGITLPFRVPDPSMGLEYR